MAFEVCRKPGLQGLHGSEEVQFSALVGGLEVAPLDATRVNQLAH